MNESGRTKSVESIEKEIDIPPQKLHVEDDLSDLPPIERRNWQKWSKNFNFLKLVIVIMIGMYVVDSAYSMLILKKTSSLQEPFFEVLKTILFTVSGYVFAKNSEGG